MLEDARCLNYASPEFSLSIVSDRVLTSSIPSAKIPERETVLRIMKSRSTLTAIINASEKAIELDDPRRS